MHTRAILLFALWLAGFAGAGCAFTSKNAPAPLAVVVVQDTTRSQLGSVAAEVFQDHDYRLINRSKTSLGFEKPGSKSANLAYGSWLSSSSVWVQVKLSIVPVEDTSFRLECAAHLVTDHGEPTEEPVRFGRLDNAPFQAMLGEIVRRLHEQNPPAPAGQTQ